MVKSNISDDRGGETYLMVKSNRMIGAVKLISWLRVIR